jgi:hypothetical protein
MNYSKGIWVSVSPLSEYDSKIQKAGELPRVEDFFPADDYPKQLTTGDVRGHTAWVKELSPSFDCAKTSSETIPSPSASSTGTQYSAPSAVVMYDPATIGDLNWIENGAVIDVAGPFPADTLKRVAEDITWLP